MSESHQEPRILPMIGDRDSVYTVSTQQSRSRANSSSSSSSSSSTEIPVISPKHQSLSPNYINALKHSNSQISIIHDEHEAKDMPNEELDAFQQEMEDALQNEIDKATKKQEPIPKLSIFDKTGFPLTLDTEMKQFKPSSDSKDPFTPTLTTKETKELCEKLDNINIVVNDINQYIKNHKSTKIKNDQFIIEKLQEIQDDIEDSEAYIEENIDKKFVEYDHNQKLNIMNNDKQEERINELNQSLEQNRHQIQQLLLQTQQQQNRINELLQNSPKSIKSQSHYPPSLQSRISSLSRINEMEEKEGRERSITPHRSYSIASRNNDNQYKEREHKFEMNKLRKKLTYLQNDQLITFKQNIYDNYYKEMNQFIMKITQTRFKLLC